MTIKNILATACVVVTVPLAVEAGTSQRDLSEFLAAQGDTVQFFPPVPDYVGWADAAPSPDAPPVTFCLVDYAAIADEFLGGSIGTSVNGRVFEKPLGDGSAEVKVILQTRHAMGFAQSIADIIDQGFVGAPTIFGNKTVDIEAEASAATGTASLEVAFRIAAPGDPLPNLLDVLNTPDFIPVRLAFRSTTVDPGNGVMKVQQVAATAPDGSLAYTRERCEIQGNGGQ